METRKEITNVSDLIGLIPTDNIQILEFTEAINLNGLSINFPLNYVLFFNGGTLNNSDRLTFNNTEIRAADYTIFYDILVFKGNIKSTIFSEWMGISGDGINDNTKAMLNAHSLGKVYYKNGIYLFKGKNLNLYQGCIERESTDGVVFTNGRYMGVIQFDRSGYLIGLQHNHLEEKKGNSVTSKIEIGNIIAPPLQQIGHDFNIDVICSWYNDFGLEAIRNNHKGWEGWYTWEWAHTDAAVDIIPDPHIKRGYQAKRHPLLGWYRGDEQNVLDWQCYWLLEAGIKGCILQPRGNFTQLDASSWNNAKNINNWIYKLLNIVPNAKRLKFIPWCDSSVNSGDNSVKLKVERAWDNNIKLIHNSELAYVINYKGKRYLSVYVFEGEYLRGLYDRYLGSINTRTFFINRTKFVKNLGYDGLCVMARNETANSIMNRADLLKNDCYYLATHYINSSEKINAPYSSYSDLIRDFKHNNKGFGEIVTIPTDCESSYHPSNFQVSGSTPDLFKQLVQKGIDCINSDSSIPRILNVYNVSEWAEAGAGLIPTMRNGYKYLDVIKESLIQSQERQNINTII